MKKNSVKRILIIRIDFLGDMVCTTPLLHAIKARWSRAEIHVLASKYNSPVLVNNPSVSKVYHYVFSKHYEKNDRPGFLNYCKDRARLILTLRSMKFDLLVIPSGGMNKNAIRFARQLNIPDCRWHNSATEFDDRNNMHVANRTLVHEALSGFLLLPELDMPDIARLKLHVFPSQSRILSWQKILGDKNKPRVGFFVKNNSADRCWPLQKWQALSKALSEKCEIVVFNSPQKENAAARRESGHARWTEAATPTVSDLIAAMMHLDIVVSADSAPVHLASASGIPVVALFESRPEKYRRWHPIGVRYILLHEGRQVGDIACASVYAAVVKLLSENFSCKAWPGEADFSSLHLQSEERSLVG